MSSLSKTIAYEAADELRSIATAGLHYSKGEYDQARYRKVLDIALKLVSEVGGRSVEDLHKEYMEDNWVHVSPMHGSEAVVFREDKILLMKRSDDGKWCVPGGLVEVGETLAESAVRELEEEVGLKGKAARLLGIFDSRKWKSQTMSQMFHAVFLVECEIGQPSTSNEAVEVGFFSEGELPMLSPGHDARVPYIFRLIRGEVGCPHFDL